VKRVRDGTVGARSTSAIITKALPAVRPFDLPPAMPRAPRTVITDPVPGAAGDAPASKTRRKHAMHALQDLGEALVSLDPARLRTLDLPERLHDAVTLARSITRHEARRRQMQYIGRLMRDVDPAPLEAALRRWNEGPAEERARFAALERWRTRLLDEAGGLADFVAEHPAADRAELAALVNAARAERATGGPPHRQRALFRAIRKASAPAAAAGDGNGETDEDHA
jgi:ribosome-associated protein